MMNQEPKVLDGWSNKLVAEYKNTQDFLLYLLGNENNYTFLAGAKRKISLDDQGRIKFYWESREIPMYKLMNDAAKAMKALWFLPPGSHL